MKEKINIAEILKDKKEGIRLYSPIFGECAFCYVREDTNDICVKKHNGVIEYFNSEGLYFALGEVMLFPSKEMRDWSKLAWNTGDILVNKDGNAHVIFEGFDDDTYETFNGNNYLWKNDGITMCFGEYEDELPTSDFSKANKEYAQKHIHQIEKRLGYKLNIETLKIEKQNEFKDGDVVVTDAVPSMCYSKCIFILKGDLNTGESRANSYVFFNINNNHISYDVLDTIERDRNIHLATDSEKQQLFSALEKEGKAWDAEKKKIVDLKPKVELKPFDKVLSRRCSEDYWVLNFYSHKTDYYHICIDGSSNLYCIPYNEETAHLLGTTDDWKGGDG